MEKKIFAGNLKLTKNSQQFKLTVTEGLEHKIRLMCSEYPDNEWSGILFYTYTGSIKRNNLAIKAVDFHLMDIGSSTYTEFDYDDSIAGYYADNIDIIGDCKMGLIHSHDRMETFFSSTDQNTLKAEGFDANNFVSLIVNDAGTYTAAVTRKVEHTTKTDTTVITEESDRYDFFDKESGIPIGKKTKSKKTDSNTDVGYSIEWYSLSIDVKPENTSLDHSETDEYIKERIPEILKKKEISKVGKKSHNTKKYDWADYPEYEYPDDDYSAYHSFYDMDELRVPLINIFFNEKSVDNYAKQLVTGSIMIDTKTPLEKFINVIPDAYKHRFPMFTNFQKFVAGMILIVSNDMSLSVHGTAAYALEARIALFKKLSKYEGTNPYIDEMCLQLKNSNRW